MKNLSNAEVVNATTEISECDTPNYPFSEVEEDE
jgi:hypothetical protein